MVVRASEVRFNIYETNLVSAYFGMKPYVYFRTGYYLAAPYTWLNWLGLVLFEQIIEY